MTATRAEVAKMDAQQAAVAELLEQAEDEASSFLSNLLNPASEQIEGAVLKARERFRAWTDEKSATGKRRWALEGVNDRGRRYTVDDWQSLGQDIASELAQAVGLFWENGTANAVTAPQTQTVVQVVEKAEEVAAAVEKAAEELAAAAGKLAEPWPLKVKLGVGLGVGVVTIGVVGYGVRSFRGLLGGFIP